MAVSSKFLDKGAFVALSLLSLAFHAFSAADIHDLLPQYNLPKGLLPRDIGSYFISQEDSSFTIELSSSPCYVNFNGQSVYYGKTIKGKFGYGKVSGVSGIQAKKLFIWVSVDGIDVDEKNDMIEFHVGALSQKLPAEEFETVKSCKAKGLRETLDFMDA